MNTTETALKSVVATLTRGRVSTFQVSLERLAAIAREHGLFSALPDLSSSRLDDLWRANLKSALCGRRWSIRGHLPAAWVVTCPHNGNFWIAPAGRKAKTR
jgi:hypothetical protein